MKKLLALLLVLVMCVGVLAACKKDEAQGPSLDQAKEYLNGIMKTSNGKATPNDYDVVGKVIIDGTAFEVTWTTDKENITVKPSANNSALWTIDVPDVNAEEIEYHITATIKNAAGETVQLTFNKKLPVLDSTGVVTAPVAGTAYKLFLEQVNLGYTLYALNTTQNDANKYINTTLDPEAAADYYVEAVEGGIKIYTEIEGTKYYVNANLVIGSDGHPSKHIGLATESDAVYTFDSNIGTWTVTLNNTIYGVGTYNAFETISISESTYFTPDKINVEGGQFPIGFMLSSYAETLAPDEKPVANDPAPNSTLTIAEAIALGNTKVKDQYTEGKYYVTGVITQVYQTTYGNMYITDGTNTLTIYGTYDATGANRYDAMSVKPVAGDTVTVYGVIGKYDDPQMKNGWITSHTPAGGGEGGGVTPDPTPSVTLGVVDAPVAGTAYKFGMVQQNVNNTIYYLAGGMSSYYMATTSDASAALDVYLETTEGGYYLYCYVGETKTYINMVVSGTHVNGAYEATASTVYTYDANSKTIKAVVNNEDYWFGTRNDNTYTTMGPCAVSYAGFYGQFYAEVEGDDDGGETPEVCEHVDANGDYVCDNTGCGEIVPPAADSVLTVEQALALAGKYSSTNWSGHYTTGKYYVTGVIAGITNTTKGTFTIADENGNQFTVYTSFNADGSVGFADLGENQPLKGDTVTVYGVVGAYGTNVQMNDGWITAHTAHTHNYSPATCTNPAICTICNGTGEAATGHGEAGEDGLCPNCGENLNAPVLEETFNIAANAGTLSDENKTITWTSDNFNFVGKQASSSTAIRTSDTDHFRIYASSTFSISGNNGQTITKIVITVTESKYASVLEASLQNAGATVTTNGTVVTIELGGAESVDFVASAQFRVKSFTISYKA